MEEEHEQADGWRVTNGIMILIPQILGLIQYLIRMQLLRLMIKCRYELQLISLNEIESGNRNQNLVKSHDICRENTLHQGQVDDDLEGVDEGH